MGFRQHQLEFGQMIDGIIAGDRVRKIIVDATKEKGMDHG